MKQKIFIIGTGAIGKVLAVFLTAAGRDVILIKGRNHGHQDEISLLQVKLTDGSQISATVRVTSINSLEALDGVIVMANKSIGNNDIADKLKQKCGQSPVVLLQNGLDIEQPLIGRGIQNVFRCVLYATSQPLTDTTLQFKPVATSPIGCVSGDGAMLAEVVALLDTPQFRFSSEDNIQTSVWRKVIANCVFNSICPLLETDNGIFHRSEEARALAEEIIEECVSIATRNGVALNAREVLKTVLQISKASDGQLISTLQDIKKRRPTEIDSLNFAIVRAAERHSELEKVTKTKMLGELIRLKSGLNSDLQL
jgi:2-dehydropantoate 2-reductase